MANITGALAALAATQHGVLTSDDCHRHGLGDGQRRALVTHGALIVVHRGTYRVASSPDTFRSRCAAASLAAGAIITGTSAGHLWGFRHVSPPHLPAVLLPHGTHSLSQGATVRRSAVIEPIDWVRFDDGILRASPPRTWFDCARDVDDERFEAITEWTLDHHTNLPTLWSTLRRLAANGRPGSGRVRRVMSSRSAWQRPAGSQLELRVLHALEDRGVPELVRQHPIRLQNGLVVHPDGADPATRWAVEVDHVTWHGGRFDSDRDKERDRWLRLVGWECVRVTDSQLRTDFGRTLDEVAELHRRHVARAA